MIQYAAFGWATLTWWTWPLIFLVTMAAVYAAVWFAFRSEREPDGPVPCLAHLGTEPDGIEWWCMLIHRHDGVHRNQWGGDPAEDLDEFNNEFPQDTELG